MSQRKWILPALIVVAAVSFVLALPPSCTTAWWNILSQATAIAGGNQTTGVQQTQNLCQYDITGTVYHNSVKVSAGLGQWNANPATGNVGYCYPQFGSSLDYAAFSGQRNIFHNKVFNTEINDNWPISGSFCHQTGVVNDRIDSCVAEPCCGPGTGIGCGSPLMVDTHDVGFGGHFASTKWFDLKNTGKPMHIHWPDEDSGLMFLARDLNHDGQITDGHELFGNDCGIANGFLKLRRLLKPGHEKDAWLTEDNADADEWNQLVLWDGYSGRLYSLKEIGITGFNLNYTTPHRTQRDRFGDIFAEWSTIHGLLRDLRIVDVWLVEEERS